MNWQLDKAHTTVSFSVKHMMVANVRGSFDVAEATIDVDEQNPERSKVVALIDAASVNTGEPQRDGHLRSADFFDAETYPHLRFESKSVKAKDGEIKLVGDLTIRDVTREVELKGAYEGPLMDPWGNRRGGFEVETTINREDFGLTWNQALEAGGVLVGKKVKIGIEAEVVEQAQEQVAA
jgi:polyisoprenoid-binding protein YceI